MSDNKPKEEKKEEDNFVPSLDQVHQLAVEAVENEDDKDDDEIEEQASDNESESSRDDEVKDEEVVEEEKPKEKEYEPTPPPEKEATPVQTNEEDIPKVKIKDSDGNEHEFASTDDIPDDFEPETYKSFAVATAKLAQREIAVEKARAEAEAAQAEAARLAEIDKIKEGWNADLKMLMNSGEIPKSGEEHQKIVDGVYGVMQDELNAGRPASSFAQAYELYQYRNSRLEAQNKTAQKNEEKKKRGAKVFGSGGANPTSSNAKGKVIEAPPAGVTLDQIHDKILSSL